jgi:hypothetical protein
VRPDLPDDPQRVAILAPRHQYWTVAPSRLKASDAGSVRSLRFRHEATPFGARTLPMWTLKHGRGPRWPRRQRIPRPSSDA